ncbi:BnaCnng35630D [Brassica napus]|uniref:Uncharacterized protein n=2 Tax=Brassica TaxID=3705 RepID=A0A3P6EQJ4_BRAOL|nr:unnamed protein product [Brassica napus]CDY59880.1 BnaCnng35630D [Brassica napus]VDD35795.1 unnamed protein product [Brassica oleracea]
MKNLLLRDDDSPRSRKKNISIQLLLFSRSLTWMDMDLHLDISNQTLEQVD